MINSKQYTRLNALQLPSPMVLQLTRRNIGSKDTRKFGIQETADILYFSCGLVDGIDTGGTFQRTIPTAENAYMCEIYVAIRNLHDFPQGLYHYNFSSHSFDVLINKSQFSEFDIFGDISFIESSPAVIILITAKKNKRYKSLKNSLSSVPHIDYKHIFQHAFLTSAPLGIHCRIMEKLELSDVCNFLDIDEHMEIPISIFSLT